jgi:hypothetical protein
MREGLLWLVFACWVFLDNHMERRQNQRIHDRFKQMTTRLEDLQLQLNRMQVESIIDQADPHAGSYGSEI